jgi:p-hydroxybenzoate 3-monooxygenase
MSPSTVRTTIAIVGAGPAGLTLAYLLHQIGIDSTIIESRSREYVEARVRAGVLESASTELLTAMGVGERMQREGLLHHGCDLRFNGHSHRIDFNELTGKGVTVYGQQEVVKDLIGALLGAGVPMLFETEAYAITGLDDERARVHYRTNAGEEVVLEADFVVGCDGFHGISRKTIPDDILRVYDHVYPFSWLGVLAISPPVSEELIYVNHERGFALVSMRSPTVTRLYLQCEVDEDIAQWPAERFWNELRLRLDSDNGGPNVVSGEILQMGVTPMRSFVAEPMRYKKLFLTGDSAHIVPPTGAKGMNLALADVRILSRGLQDYYAHGDSSGLDAYSATCLRRIWKTERFSAWMTKMLHRFPDHNEFERRVQIAELDYVTSSRAASTTLAENYVGLPFEGKYADLRLPAAIG